MPVYDRRYRGYAGERRAVASRVWTIARHAFGGIFQSRLALLLVVVAALPPIGFALVVYTAHNLEVLALFGQSADIFLAIDRDFFFYFLVTQSVLAFLLTAFVGPGLIAPDLAHNALPLYFSRPLGRKEYVGGKLVVLGLLLSAITWIPGLLLFVLEGSLAPSGWFGKHAGLGWAIFAASWVWIAVVALLAVAISAWVRWRAVATGMLFGVFVVMEAFGRAIEVVLETRWGQLLILDDLIELIWSDLFGRRVTQAVDVPVWSAWLVVGLVVALSLALIHRKVRPAEVVR